MGSHEYLGEMNVIATGDFLQLQPMGNKWISNKIEIYGQCVSDPHLESIL